MYFFFRIFFVLSFFLVFGLSIYFISNIYQKWSASPVIIGLNAIATSISDIPFPAITICNMNQAKKSIVQHYQSGSNEYVLLQSVCQQFDDFNISDVPPNFSGKWSTFKEFLLKVCFV